MKTMPHLAWRSGEPRGRSGDEAWQIGRFYRILASQNNLHWRRLMNTDTEGMLVASHCMLVTLMAKLVETQVLKPAQILDAAGDAEGYLAGLSPPLMSPAARTYAKVVLQKMGKIS
jgi:hypothetical protein